ncbi:hypothetical protein FOZ61_001343, partial [Perkinsus olseni]
MSSTPISASAFKELASANCTEAMADEVVAALQSLGAERFVDIEGVLNNETLLSSFNKKLYAEEENETEHQKVKRCMAQERAKVELRSVLDSLSGKRVPVAQVRADYLTRASSKFGGFLSSNLTIDPVMLRSVFDDPGAFKQLRVSADQVMEEESVEP